MEIDIIAESIDKSTILVGEVKWMNNVSTTKVINELQEKTKMLPFLKSHKIIHVLFLKHFPQKTINNAFIFTPADVVSVLK